jgi:hypothetical protein
MDKQLPWKNQKDEPYLKLFQPAHKTAIDRGCGDWISKRIIGQSPEDAHRPCRLKGFMLHVKTVALDQTSRFINGGCLKPGFHCYCFRREKSGRLFELTETDGELLEKYKRHNNSL